MRKFARLYNELDATTATTRKLDALKKYFSANEPGNAAELPAVLIAFDLLEHSGGDIRGFVQLARRARLEEIVQGAGNSALMLSPLIKAPDCPTLEVLRSSSRARGVEGVILKSINAHYGVGRTKEGGVWWKWKLDPYTVDAVLVYAQRGHGRRASLYTDYTFEADTLDTLKAMTRNHG